METPRTARRNPAPAVEQPPGEARGGHGPAFWYYDQHALPLPARHRYPRARFTAVREQLLADGTLTPSQLHAADPASWDLLEQVHTTEYLGAVRDGRLSPQAIREIGLPFSQGLVQRARAAVGATTAAAWHAVRRGGASATGVIGGGTHHAFADRGAGYCLFSDIAVAIRDLQRQHAVHRVAIVDLDVHQGNGNAEIFAQDPRVFTFSMHGARNWPHRKATSDLDVALQDGTDDADYLAALAPPLERVLDEFRPDLVFYLAGADPLHCDRLGRLALTHAGLRSRDRRVLEACAARYVPVVVTLGGGYGQPMEETVAVHVNTVEEIQACFGAGD